MGRRRCVFKILQRSSTLKNQEDLRKIASLQQKLFPNNILQERFDSFIPYYLNHGSDFIAMLQKEINPLDLNFLILTP